MYFQLHLSQSGEAIIRRKCSPLSHANLPYKSVTQQLVFQGVIFVVQSLRQLTLAGRAPDFSLRYNCGNVLMGAFFAWLEEVLLKLHKLCFILLGYELWKS